VSPYQREWAISPDSKAVFIRGADPTVQHINIVVGCGAAMCDGQHVVREKCCARMSGTQNKVMLKCTVSSRAAGIDNEKFQSHHRHRVLAEVGKKLFLLALKGPFKCKIMLITMQQTRCQTSTLLLQLQQFGQVCTMLQGHTSRTMQPEVPMVRAHPSVYNSMASPQNVNNEERLRDMQRDLASLTNEITSSGRNNTYPRSHRLRGIYHHRSIPAHSRRIPDAQPRQLFALCASTFPCNIDLDIDHYFVSQDNPLL
jgi:hypothetical protein